MKCPACKAKGSRVVDVKKHENHNYRRLECQECFTRFSTKETITFTSLDPYIREKILTGAKL